MRARILPWRCKPPRSWACRSMPSRRRIRHTRLPRLSAWATSTTLHLPLCGSNGRVCSSRPRPRDRSARRCAVGKYYDEALIPDELRRTFDVYDRIRALQLSLGSFETDVVSLANAGIAGVVLHESGLVYLSGTTGGTLPMNDDEERLKHGQQAGQQVADTLIKRLHWALSCGGEGDLNDVLYTVKALGMVVSPGGGAFRGAPAVVNGFSFGWHFPLPPVMLDKVKALHR